MGRKQLSHVVVRHENGTDTIVHGVWTEGEAKVMAATLNRMAAKNGSRRSYRWMLDPFKRRLPEAARKGTIDAA